METSLTITLNGTESGASVESWINLEQEGIPTSQNNVSTSDLNQMLARALSGLSARSYPPDRCPSVSIDSKGTVSVKMTLYVWPSSLGLPYTLQATGATIGDQSAVRHHREIDIAATGQEVIGLPWITEQAEVAWQLGCFDRSSESIVPPGISVDGPKVVLTKACYGVMRLRGVALGYSYPVVCSFAKVELDPESGEYAWSATDEVTISVTASWVDAAGESRSEILEMMLPDCAKDLLELCPNDVPKVIGLIVPEQYKKRPRLRYNACNGQPIDTDYVDE